MVTPFSIELMRCLLSTKTKKVYKGRVHALPFLFNYFSMSYIENIQVSEKTLNEIKTALGYPVIDAELEDILSEQHIKEYVLGPSLETFFTYFPIRFQISIPVTGANAVQEYDAPINTLGLFKYQFVPQSSTIGGSNMMQQGMFYGNPFYSSSQVISRGSYGLGGNFGTPFGYEKELFTYQNRFYNKSIESSNKVVFIQYNDNTRKLEYKANIPGVFSVELATYSSIVEDIPLRYRQKFLQYAKGKLLTNFANIMKLSESDLPSNIDADYLEDKGNTWIEEAETYFREASFIPMVR